MPQRSLPARLSLFWLAAALAALLGLSPVAAGETDLPVPRFVSVRSGEVNLRTGPGTRYPVDWVLLRPSMPVEILAEFENWRRIRDVDGTTGWVHQSMLSGQRTVLVTGETRTLRQEPSSWSAPVARLEPGVIANVETCQSDWCQVQVSGMHGWIRRAEVWGLYPNETIE